MPGLWEAWLSEAPSVCCVGRCELMAKAVLLEVLAPSYRCHVATGVFRTWQSLVQSRGHWPPTVGAV